MITHQEIVKEIAQELYHDTAVSALILYGSVSRQEESANSDIDLLAIIDENILQKRHSVRYGITVEFVEMPFRFLEEFIAKKEAPMLFALANGAVLFDKTSATDPLIAKARQILADGPHTDEKWANEGYRTKRRSDLTEIYTDLLDVGDEIEFNYLASLLVTGAIPMLIEINNWWYPTRKKTMEFLKSHCIDGYQAIETLLSPARSLPERREAAKRLIACVFHQDGGILEGGAVLFRKNHI